MKPLLYFTGILFSLSLPAKDMIRTSPDVPILGELEEYLAQNLLFEQANRDAGLADINQKPGFKALIKKHGLNLFGGPVIGKVTPTSAVVWLRTPDAAQVKVTAQPGNTTGTAKTSKVRDFTAEVELKGLKPWTEYRYTISVNGEPALGKLKPSFRTAPTREQKVAFSIAFGGGARVNPPKEVIWDHVAKTKPFAFLFLGDNLYIDKPLERNRQRLYYYRRQLRPEYQRLMGSTAAYAIWDDHDFGANDCSGGLDPFKPAWKVPVWRVFKENWPNAYFGGGEKQPGCWFDFNIGDVDFFMTDGRYYRDYKKGTMLGPVQKKWLLEKLKASKATFKVICSGTLWTETADKGGKDSWWGVPEEREEIFSLIDREKIGGVILLSADRHRTDVYQIKRPNGYTLYEFETSKLTNNHTHGTKKEALFSYNKGNYFGHITFDLTKADPQLTFKCITVDKGEVYSLTLNRSQLQK